MSRSKIAVLLAAAAVVVIGAIVAIGFALSGSGDDGSTHRDQVRLEIRAKPKARIVMNGKVIGKTPMSIYVPKDTAEITIGAIAIEHVMPLGGKPMDRERQLSKTIVPDHDQLVDFVLPPERIQRPEPE